MRLHKLNERLYVSNWPDAKALSWEKFDTILTVCKKELPENLQTFAYNYVHIPLSDGKKLPENLSLAHDLTLESCLAEQKTLVHCYLGHNRSYLVATMVYAALEGITYKQSLAAIRKHYPKAIDNPVFEEYLNS